jgi:hypothetical protein
MIDDSGWKQISSDVFRKPRYSLLLCVLVGTGIQVNSIIHYFYNVLLNLK